MWVASKIVRDGKKKIVLWISMLEYVAIVVVGKNKFIRPIYYKL